MYQPPFREIYLTEVSEVGLPIQKSKYAIRIVGEKRYLTQFDTKEQVDGWCKLLGVSMKETPDKPKYFPDGTKMYELNKTVQRFTLGDKSILPQGAIHHKGMCNGSIVDCYVTVADESFTIYMPSPFSRKPIRRLSSEEHNKYIQDKNKFLLYSGSYI